METTPRHKANGRGPQETLPRQPCQDQTAIDHEHARLEGVMLAVREIAHRINNHMTPAVCILALLQRQADLSPELQERIQQALLSLYAVADDIRKFQRVEHIETVDTPFGPTLDLDRSVAPWPFTQRRAASD